MLGYLISKIIRLFEQSYLNNFDFNQMEHQKLIEKIKFNLFRFINLGTGNSDLHTLIKRSVAQFIGHQHWNPSILNVVSRHILSFFFLPIYLITLLISNIFCFFKSKTNNNVDVVLLSQINSTNHKDLFLDIFNTNSAICDGKHKKLNIKDICFILTFIIIYFKIVAYPELILRIVNRIAQYSYTISELKCKTIITISSEGSPWSSILTGYCRANFVKHGNIMHGIRFYSSQNAFSEFDEFYIWGQYHLEQMLKMYIYSNKFLIYGNPLHRKLNSLINRSSKIGNNNILIGFDYPIMAVDHQVRASLIEILDQIDNSWNINFRPHPSFIKESCSFLEQIRGTSDKHIYLQHPGDWPLHKSLNTNIIVISCYSDILTDAWITGIKCIYIYSPKVPLQEFHFSKNFYIFRPGDNIQSLLANKIVLDKDEIHLRQRFSYNYDNSQDTKIFTI